MQRIPTQKLASDRALTSSRTRISSPLVIVREERRVCSNNLPRRNATATRARAMDQDYPTTGPSPGANPTIYPSSLPRASGNLFSDISPKSHGFFFSVSSASSHTSANSTSAPGCGTRSPAAPAPAFALHPSAVNVLSFPRLHHQRALVSLEATHLRLQRCHLSVRCVALFLESALLRVRLEQLVLEIDDARHVPPFDHLGTTLCITCPFFIFFHFMRRAIFIFIFPFSIF